MEFGTQKVASWSQTSTNFSETVSATRSATWIASWNLDFTQLTFFKNDVTIQHALFYPFSSSSTVTMTLTRPMLNKQGQQGSTQHLQLPIHTHAHTQTYINIQRVNTEMRFMVKNISSTSIPVQKAKKTTRRLYLKYATELLVEISQAR